MYKDSHTWPLAKFQYPSFITKAQTNVIAEKKSVSKRLMGRD